MQVDQDSEGIGSTPSNSALHRNTSPSVPSYTGTPATSTLSLSSRSASPFTALPLEPLKPTRLPVRGEGEFVWNLKDWRNQLREALLLQGPEAKVLSPEFDIGGEQWQVLVRAAEDSNWLSLFLTLAHPELKTDKDWAVCVEFILAVQANKHTTDNGPVGYQQSSFRRLSAEVCDWGFNRFYSLTDLADSVADDLVIRAHVRVVQDVTGILWHSFDNYNSKRVTGYVGLENQGATCYMNSFLQSLFLTNALRAAVYRIPTTDEVTGKSIPLALQRLFHQLQSSPEPPHTNELTRSFGWDMAESFQQHDVQEFSRVLLDALESAMKKSAVEGTVEKVFRGRLRNVLRCLNVDYESTRSESFYDLQMTIRGVKNLEESFERYVMVEKLDGKNQYRTEQFGLQDAEKFVIFEHLPPVLHVHLERYAFNLHTGHIDKVHDRFEFPLELDLSRYLAKDSEQRPEDQQYWLHSVLVHAGSGHGGHYYVYIRHPSNPDRWFKFDDTTVLPCTEHEAVNDNFGHSPSAASPATLDSAELYRTTGTRPSRIRSWTSAYLLVYIRKGDMSEILEPVGESAVPSALIERFKSDAEAERRRTHERLMMNVNLVTDDIVAKHRGADLFDPEGPGSETGLVRVAKDSTIASLIPPDGESYEIYSITPRRNRTLRPDVPIDLTDPRALVSLSNRLTSTNDHHAFYLRAISADDKDNPWRRPLVPAQRHILLYVKWFDDRTDHRDGQLLPLGSVAVDREAPVSSLAEAVCSRLGLPGGTALGYYEELKPSKISVLSASESFSKGNIRQGDIIIVCREHADKTPIEYFARINSWVSTTLRPLDGSQPPTQATISTQWTLPEFVAFVADTFSVPEADRARLRLGLMLAEDSETKSANSNIHFWKYSHVAASTVADLLRAVIPENPSQPSAAAASISIGWELTPGPVLDVEKSMLRYWVEAGLGLSAELAAALPRAVYLPKFTATASQLIAHVSGEGQKETASASLRLLECHGGKIKRTFAPGTASELISHINIDAASLYLEAKAPDECDGDKLLSVFSYERAISRPHSIPTKFALKPDESVKAMRGRLARRLAIPSLDGANLSLCNWSRERPLTDEHEVLARTVVVEDDQLAVQCNDPVKAAKRAAVSDGSIRIRKAN